MIDCKYALSVFVPSAIASQSSSVFMGPGHKKAKRKGSLWMLLCVRKRKLRKGNTNKKHVNREISMQVMKKREEEM